MINTVILDAGHGGLKDGKYQTKGKSFTFPGGETAYEGVLNRNICLALQKELQLLGLNVIFTVDPKDPSDLSLQARVDIANRNKGNALFVSIHNNAGGGSGFEIFTTVGQNVSDGLAEAIYQRVEPLYKSLGIPLRTDMQDGDHDKEDNFYVIKGAQMPSVLIECLFFDNLADYLKLKDALFIKRLSMAIAQGIKDFISSIK